MSLYAYEPVASPVSPETEADLASASRAVLRLMERITLMCEGSIPFTREERLRTNRNLNAAKDKYRALHQASGRKVPTAEDLEVAMWQNSDALAQVVRWTEKAKKARSDRAKHEAAVVLEFEQDRLQDCLDREFELAEWLEAEGDLQAEAEAA